MNEMQRQICRVMISGYPQTSSWG